MKSFFFFFPSPPILAEPIPSRPTSFLSLSSIPQVRRKKSLSGRRVSSFSFLFSLSYFPPAASQAPFLLSFLLFSVSARPLRRTTRPPPRDMPREFQPSPSPLFSHPSLWHRVRVNEWHPSSSCPDKNADLPQGRYPESAPLPFRPSFLKNLREGGILSPPPLFPSCSTPLRARRTRGPFRLHSGWFSRHKTGPPLFFSSSPPSFVLVKDEINLQDPYAPPRLPGPDLGADHCLFPRDVLMNWNESLPPLFLLLPFSPDFSA